jgi:O-acetyl-ADP-ribose deacetylase (regulator of RNase III)
MKVVVGDVTKLREVEVIVVASNGVGSLNRGAAGAVGDAGGPALAADVRRVCRQRKSSFHPGYGYEAGECFSSKPGDLAKRGVKSVYHAVVAKFPNGPTSTFILQNAIRSAFQMAVRERAASIAVSGMTGLGIPSEKAAVDIADIAASFADSIEVTICDLDKEFIEHVKRRIQTEDE